MLIGTPGYTKGFVAGEALAAHRYVKLNSSGEVIYSTGANEDAIGITRSAVASGATVDVALCAAGGTMVLEVDGNAANIAVGDEITTHSATGQGQKTGSTAATAYFVRGIALDTATADATEILVLLVHYIRTYPA